MGLTKEQTSAMDFGLGNCCVSASAGSGKTRVLTQRVIKLIKEGTNLSEFLILTFTNLAASEMRDRIRDELQKEDKDKYCQIIASLDAANIQTYDAFALNIVKKYHDRLSLPKEVSLIDEVLLEIQKHKILNSIFSNFYKNNDPDVLSLVDEYCYKNDSTLKKFIINVSQQLDLKENKSDFIKNYEKLFLNEKFINDAVDKQILIINNQFKEIVSHVKTFDNPEYYDLNEEFFNTLLSCDTYDKLHSLLVEQDTKPQTKKGIFDDCPDDKEYHQYILDYRKKIKKQLAYSSQKEIVEQYLGTRKHVKTILNIVFLLDKEMNEYKRKYSVYSFSDIFKFALQLSQINDVRDELKNKFKYIMIDEYQDTSDLQDKFISNIANNNVYVVGDVKQSIYRFRNANCDLFATKMDKYSRNEGGELIKLPDNFRSREEVVNTVNYIFETLMDKKSSGLDYLKDHKMKFGNNSYIKEDDIYQTEFLEYSDEEIEQSIYQKDEYEARLIATDIATKVNNGMKVYDKDTKKLRCCDYSDFAILMRTKTKFSIYQKVFNDYQIPLFANYEKSIKENNFTLVFENIIKLIEKTKNNDYSHGYKHSYISVMRSFLMNATSKEVEDVATIENNYDSYPLKGILEDIVKETEGKNLKQLIIKIVDKFDVYNRVITIGNVNDTHSLIEYYYNIASQMDQMGYNIEDFLTYFEDLNKFEIEPAFMPNDSIPNCVKLLTIHASKGLQFKICYFPNLRNQFNFGDTKGPFLYSDVYGMSLPNVNHRIVDGFINNLMKDNEKRETIKEQVRLFYVALTRAEEKIIFVGDPTEKKSHEDIFSCQSFLEFINLNNCVFASRKIQPTLIKNSNKEDDTAETISVKTISNMDGKQIVISHASKELDDDIDTNLLVLGNKYHYYLEITDFKTRDVSFIKNDKERILLSRFLSNDLFKNSGEAKVLHEYKFFDEVNNVSGVIDMLLIYKDHIDIVDFKLSHVDDIAYEKQLGKYKKYILQLSNLPIHTYVTGIMSGNVKKID